MPMLAAAAAWPCVRVASDAPSFRVHTLRPAADRFSRDHRRTRTVHAARPAYCWCGYVRAAHGRRGRMDALLRPGPGRPRPRDENVLVPGRVSGRGHGADRVAHLRPALRALESLAAPKRARAAG